MSFETPNTYNELKNKIEQQELTQVWLEKGKEQISKQAEIKKDELNQEYLSNLIGSFLGKEALKWNQINYSISEKKATINNKELTLLTHVSAEKVGFEVQDYFEREYFEHSHQSDIFKYITSELSLDNLTTDQIKEILDSPEKLKDYLETIWKTNNVSFKAILDYLGDNYIESLWSILKAKLYVDTNDWSYLDEVWGIEEKMRGLVWDKYVDNYNDTNPLLKTAVVWGWSIYGIFKLFSFINSKISTANGGIGWFKAIFWWAVLELVWQVAMWKSLTGSAIKEVSKVFQWTDNWKQLETTAKMLDKKGNSLALWNFRALTYMFGTSPMEDTSYFDLISEWNGTKWQEDMVQFICEQNNISSDELRDNVIKGNENILNDISTKSGISFTIQELLSVTWSTYNEKVFKAIERSEKVEEKIEKIHQNWWGSTQEISGTYKQLILEYINNWGELKMGL